MSRSKVKGHGHQGQKKRNFRPFGVMRFMFCKTCLASSWATVSKTVFLMLSDRCPVCLSVLSVTLVHCGKMVGRIKMKVGTQVGLGPGHTVLDGDPAPPLKGAHSLNYRPISVAGK